MEEYGKDYTDEDEFVEEIKPITFDDMVSFTMFIEISLVAIAAVLFLIILYLSS